MWYRALITLVFCLPICGTAFAGFNFPDESRDNSRYEERKQYRDLIHYLKTNQRSRYLSGRDELSGYPLYPYLEYTDKIHRITRETPESIRAFVNQYVDTPLASQLTQNWLYSLAQRGQWQTFLEFYDPQATNTRENQCFYPFALYRNGQLSLALSVADSMWMVSYSQPDECDAAFKVWRDNDRLTPELAWQRYELAVMENEISLASYLERFLERADRKRANNLKLVRKKPAILANTSRFRTNDPRDLATIVFGLNRLARKDPSHALDLARIYEENPGFPGEVRDAVYTDIAIRLAREPETLPLLENVPADLTGNQKLAETLFLTYLRQLNFSQAFVYLNLLDTETQQQNRWKYWKARILDGSDNLEDRDRARVIYGEIATERSFYGFMAADKLGLPYNFQDTPAIISQEELLSLEAAPGIQRALELFVLQERTRARREWRFTTRNYSTRELQIAARVAAKWGWHAQAIRSMISAKAWDDLEPRFPLAFQDSFVTSALTADIPVHWSFAIARQESAFMPDARSSAGALGVMQLMPGTARMTASRSGVALDSMRELTTPRTNIALGSDYLGQMLRKFEDNRILASAAYNAGPSRVKGWLDPSLPLDLWVETIPFKETRGYVQNVLMFSTIYSRKLGSPAPLVYDHEQSAFSRPRVSFLDNTETDSEP